MARLLIADAHAPTLEFLTERLHADGHEPTPISDPMEAFERLAAGGIDLALCALDLPDAEGEHLARKIRNSGLSLPVLIYDAGHRGQVRGVQAILDLGANAYVPDPTDHKLLTERLRPLLAQTRPARGEGEDRDDAPDEPHLVDEGRLQRGVLARLLLTARAAGRSGLLLLQSGTTERSLYLLNGGLIGYRSNVRRESFGLWLVQRGTIDEAAYQTSLEVMARDGVSQTSALVAIGALEAGASIYEHLVAHATEHVVRAFSLWEGRYKILESSSLAREVPALELPLLPLIREGARQGLPLRFFHDTLAPIFDRYPYRTPSFAAELNAMSLTPKELAWAMRITGAQTTRELLHGARSSLRDALLLLWFFDALGVIAISDTRHESEDEGTYRSALPATRKKKPLPPDQREALVDEALTIVTASYFGALGLDIGADADAVELAYHDRATRFHPETYPDYDLDDLEDLFQTVQDKVGAAYRILSVPEKKKAYLAYLLSRQELTYRHAPISVDAELVLRRGIEALQAGDATSAKIAFTEAVEHNPREPEYHCYLAFATYRAAHGPPEERAREPRKILKKALAMDPKMEHALVLLGILEQECGHTKAARRHFLDALSANPRSVTARAALQRLDQVPAS